MQINHLCLGCDEIVDVADDDAYIQGEGPYCSECKSDFKCTRCWGRGKTEIYRDLNGRLDYLRGFPTGQWEPCQPCHGEGYRI